jgi:hypothetical protein
MNKFHELDVPKEAFLGWYMISLTGINDYLHDDGKIHSGACDAYYSSSGYFTTELEAHKMAEQYYLKNGRKYPYGVLLRAAELDAAAAIVNDGSRVMNFLG